MFRPSFKIVIGKTAIIGLCPKACQSSSFVLVSHHAVTRIPHFFLQAEAMCEQQQGELGIENGHMLERILILPPEFTISHSIVPSAKLATQWRVKDWRMVKR
jgi:hypothetical protein